MRSPILLPMRMKAAETSASSAIADWTPLTLVLSSLTTAEIDTFISDVSTTRTNIAIASRIGRRRSPAASSVGVVTAAWLTLGLPEGLGIDAARRASIRHGAVRLRHLGKLRDSRMTAGGRRRCRGAAERDRLVVETTQSAAGRAIRPFTADPMGEDTACVMIMMTVGIVLIGGVVVDLDGGGTPRPRWSPVVHAPDGHDGGLGTRFRPKGSGAWSVQRSWSSASR